MPRQTSKKGANEATVTGIPVSPGIVIGTAFVLDEFAHHIDEHRIAADAVEHEIERFQKAVADAKSKIISFRKRVLAEVGEAEAGIFDSHLAILEDPELIDKTIEMIRDEEKNAEHLFMSAVRRITDKLRQIPDAYIRERTNDVEDVAKRVVNNLLEQEGDPLANLAEPVIVVATDISPSDTAHMSPQHVIGFATDKGGPTSHTAIMATALEIPAVLGCGSLIGRVKTGDQLVVDGVRGHVIIHPKKSTLARQQDLIFEYQSFVKKLAQHESLPAETLDGFEIELGANIELPEEVDNLKNHGADRIGLFRTEFLYLNRADLPNEEEQFEVYRTVAAKMNPKPVIIRTLDLGGDKFAKTMPILRELNPYLGMRAIRLCLEFPELLRQQFRAMLRASEYGNIRIMIPMICNVNEVRQAKQIYRECQDELRKAKVAFREVIDFGIMIETPAAAICADHFVDEVDFFSIGSNDLIQYTLAVDRGNEKVAHLYEPFHPSVLRLIHNVIRVGQRNGVWVGLCGEMAGDPMMALFLAGMGIDELSMSPIRVPLIKEVIRNAHLSDLKDVAQAAINLGSPEEAQRCLREKLKTLLPDQQWLLKDMEETNA